MTSLFYCLVTGSLHRHSLSSGHHFYPLAFRACIDGIVIHRFDGCSRQVKLTEVRGIEFDAERLGCVALQIEICVG
jgi:hypothetical protein